MKAKLVENNFKRGESPHKALEIGDGRSIEELVNERIKRDHPMEEFGLTYIDLRTHVLELWKDGDFNIRSSLKDIEDNATDDFNGAAKIVDELLSYIQGNLVGFGDKINSYLIDEFLSHTSVEYQIKWWIEWLPY